MLLVFETGMTDPEFVIERPFGSDEEGPYLLEVATDNQGWVESSLFLSDHIHCTRAPATMEERNLTSTPIS